MLIMFNVWNEFRTLLFMSLYPASRSARMPPRVWQRLRGRCQRTSCTDQNSPAEASCQSPPDPLRGEHTGHFMHASSKASHRCHVSLHDTHRVIKNSPTSLSLMSSMGTTACGLFILDTQDYVSCLQSLQSLRNLWKHERTMDPSFRSKVKTELECESWKQKIISFPPICSLCDKGSVYFLTSSHVSDSSIMILGSEGEEINDYRL